jgi:hypothetical protein
MNAKMKECFTPHAMSHTLLGVGLGLVLVSLLPSLGNLTLGVVLVVTSLVLDMMRK